MKTNDYVIWSNRDTSISQEEIDDEFEFAMEDLDCNILIEGEAIIIGTLQRWDAAHRVYKGTGQDSISRAIKAAINSFEPWDSFEIKSEDGELKLYQWGHDNPTNPSIMNIRTAYPSLDVVEENYENAVESGEIPPKSSMVDFILNNTSPIQIPELLRPLSNEIEEESER